MNGIIRCVILVVMLIFLNGENVVAQAPGFFLDEHETKTATIPGFEDFPEPASDAGVTVHSNFEQVIVPVGKYVFGNNANPYMTQMVDEPILLDHIRDLKPNVIRYPGGNLSSVFFWDAEKNGPPSDAPSKILDGAGHEVDPGYWYGRNNEGWTLSVDNYYKMLENTGSTGIITINYGYARYGLGEDPVATAAHLAAEWVRYDNGRTRYWEIGNESNGNWQAGYRINTAANRDGQPEIVTGALYGKHFKVFADSMRRAAEEIASPIYIGAQLLAEEAASWWSDTDKNWNEGVFAEAKDSPDYYIIHSYYTNYAENSSAANILESATRVTRDMMEYVTASVQDAGLEPKPVALTEWNIFAEGSRQQVSYVNGMHAAIVLGELIKNKYGLACRWDLANGWSNGNDHGMFNQGDQPGMPKWAPRPAFYYMYYFQRYFGDSMTESSVVGTEDVLAYASKFDSGEAGYVIVNTGVVEHTVQIRQRNLGVGERYYFHTLTGGTDNGEFSLKVLINGEGPGLAAGGPAGFKTIKARSGKAEGGIKFLAPSRSVTFVLIDAGNEVITETEDEIVTAELIHPNPASDQFSFTASPGENLVQILTLQGRVVFRGEVHPEQRVDIRLALPPGLYLIKSGGPNSSRTQKLLIH